jgi:hypothetical protein
MWEGKEVKEATPFGWVGKNSAFAFQPTLCYILTREKLNITARGAQRLRGSLTPTLGT